jgi:hypothetical protein
MTVPAQRRHLDNPELLTRALSERWFGGKAIAKARLGTLHIDGPYASAPLRIGSRATLLSVSFRREDDQWRLDTTRTTASADAMLQLMAALAGKNEDEYLEHLLGRLGRARPAPVSPDASYKRP